MLAFGVTVATAMLMYFSLFYLISQRGIKIIVRITTSFFSGGVIPLPFFPKTLQRVVTLLPFGSMQNVPLQILCVSLSGPEAVRSIGLQVFWLTALVFAGWFAMGHATKKVVAFGG
mgnify:CR=1 FL=1